jgi:hypothetical protein
VARLAGTGAVAIGSAIISYSHLRDAFLASQYSTLAAAVGPLVLDSFALLAIKHHQHGHKRETSDSDHAG